MNSKSRLVDKREKLSKGNFLVISNVKNVDALTYDVSSIATLLGINNFKLVTTGDYVSGREPKAKAIESAMAFDKSVVYSFSKSKDVNAVKNFLDCDTRTLEEYGFDTRSREKYLEIDVKFFI
jgi:hypothetical protein